MGVEIQNKQLRILQLKMRVLELETPLAFNRRDDSSDDHDSLDGVQSDWDDDDELSVSLLPVDLLFPDEDGNDEDPYDGVQSDW
eukprot:CAMPEP_0201576882 /NCGR_PEP_ID=MMETSP0190_2-20130828/22947_1 /ASSEMBLY_ACC=CAM_ASM_000263 /TAXON_ID=37353 /ORGANISM="Rosalina sp." /LENGTH=83 /DNA_ID=CAMNT_0048008261 /DNA_START=138 /DNA_END=389 /DNA_ORIENTATION=-